MRISSIFVLLAGASLVAGTAAIAALIPDGVQFGPQNTATTPANPLLTPGRASTTTPAQSARDPPTFA